MENKKQEKFFVSHTKLNTYKVCPMQYFYKYVLRLEKRVSRRAYYVGEDIHKLVELWLVHRTPDLLSKRVLAYSNHLLAKPSFGAGIDPASVNADAFKEGYDKWEEKAMDLWANTLTWREYMSEVIMPRMDKEQDGVKNEVGYNYVNDLIKIMGQYEYYYWNDKIKVLDLEHKRYAELGEYNGKVVVLSYISDGIVEVNGEQYLLEHKTFTSEPMSWEDTWLNVQTAEYVTELNKSGWNIKGVIWDSIKSKSPKDPNILKSGLYGKQSSEVTLFSLISTETIMKGPDAVVLEASRLMAEANSLEIVNNYSNYLGRHATVFNAEAVKAIRKDSTLVIEVISGQEVPYYRNMGWASCNYCDFKDLCQMEMLGQDSKTLIDTMYRKIED